MLFYDEQLSLRLTEQVGTPNPEALILIRAKPLQRFSPKVIEQDWGGHVEHGDGMEGWEVVAFGEGWASAC